MVRADPTKAMLSGGGSHCERGDAAVAAIQLLSVSMAKKEEREWVLGGSTCQSKGEKWAKRWGPAQATCGRGGGV
jgi:hypothetical protein